MAILKLTIRSEVKDILSTVYIRYHKSKTAYLPTKLQANCKDVYKSKIVNPKLIAQGNLLIAKYQDILKQFPLHDLEIKEIVSLLNDGQNFKEKSFSEYVNVYVKKMILNGRKAERIKVILNLRFSL